MMKRSTVSLAAVAGCLLALVATPASAEIGEPSYVSFSSEKGSFPLVQSARAAPIRVDPGDWPGVIRAAHDLQADVERVTGTKPDLITASSSVPVAAGPVVILGTIGRGGLIDALVQAGKLDVSEVRGKWESWITQVTPDPLPGVGRALVIAGSDKRGTIYGIYDLSQQIGVSPWYWWADVAPTHRDGLHVDRVRIVQGPPAVKYRGIFLNDEAPDLTNWVAAKYGYAAVRANPPVPPGVANYGHEFYSRLFEVMLRLRANYLWPAMWNNAFNEDDPANARLADEYGIVMGTSHQEPMLRAQKEWDRRYQHTVGPWNFAKRPDLLEGFWRDGIRRNRGFESVITLGLRGANDTPMAPGGPAANEALLEKIVGVQRGILRKELNPDLSQVPQMWCLYKEVQDYYDAGMRVPDDVTLLWAEDNWGNVRRLPTLAESRRGGGAGIYYHFDYHGGPRSYQWINTNPLPKIWDQMSLANEYNANRIWIVNVGHFKGYEVPAEFFLDLAWNPDRWNGGNLGDYLRLWATREFGPGHADEIASIVAGYAKYNGRRKPELLSPATYSIVNYREAETVVADYDAIAARAERLFASIPPAKRDAYYELVLFPAKACALVNRLYCAAGQNQLFAKQGRASANLLADKTRRLFKQDLALMDYFNHDLANGKWDHFMDETHLGYTSWRDPRRNSLRAIRLVELNVPKPAQLGVAVEGSESAWPAASGEPALPQFDAVNRQHHYFEIFDRGATPFAYSVRASAPWIRLMPSGAAGSPEAAESGKGTESGAGGIQGTVSRDIRIWAAIDWNTVPKGRIRGTITVAGAGQTVNLDVEAFTPTGVNRRSLDGFVEGDGVVSIEAAHYTHHTGSGGYDWTRIDDYGRTLSGMRAEGPAFAPSVVPGRNAPMLSYRMYLFDAGKAGVTAVTSPTLNFEPNHGLRYAVSFDGQPPQIVTLVPKGYSAQNGNANWEKSVRDNARFGYSDHTIATPGYHTLKIWMIDPGIVLEKLIVDLGGLKPSYLGPPESLRGGGIAESPVQE